MKNIFFSAVITVLITVTGNSQNLNKGDIVIIGIAADTGTSTTAYSEFSWVPLVNLIQGTKIYFTDAGYNAVDANFMGTGLNDEILLRYIVPVGGILAGSIQTVTEQSIPANYTVINSTKFGNDFNGLPSLPNAGDQITVFQSSDDEFSPSTFGNTSFNAIFMVTTSSLSFTALTNSTSGVTPVFNLDNVTNLAPGLIDAVNAVAVGTGPLEADETDNARYIGPTSGTKEEIVFAVSQLANWSRHDAAFGNDFAFGTVPNGWTANNATSFTLGMSLNEKDLMKISLYPNPSEQVFSIKNDSGQEIKQVNVITTNGQIVRQFNTNQSEFNVAAIASGIYFVEIILDETILIRKLIRK